MTKKALLIAYHFPPVRVSSGLQRTLAFSKYLQDYDWDAMALVPHPRAYEITSKDQLQDIPAGMVVKQAFALDTRRHLAFKGRYFDWMALPDRWVSWWIGGVISGLKLISRYKPSVIWSTYPIATAHLIGLTLHRLTGIPWVADFRDSMTENRYPREGSRRKVFLWIERRVVKYCSRAVFTTPGAIRMYAERYPDIPSDRWALIPNGYNEAIFQEVEASLNETPESEVPMYPITLVHSGVIYPSERDPRPFFNALSKLKNSGLINGDRLKIVLRATGHDHIYAPLLKQLDIEDIVELAPGVSYRDALREMLTASGLLIFQAANCDHQIPAKLYEYFRAQKPIFALTGVEGDTGTTLRESGIETIAPLDDEESIRENIYSFFQSIENGTTVSASMKIAVRYSREYAAGTLAGIFNDVTSS